MIPQEPLSSTCILVRSLGVVVEMFIPIGDPATAEALPQSRTGPTGARSAVTRQRWPTPATPLEESMAGVANTWRGAMRSTGTSSRYLAFIGLDSLHMSCCWHLCEVSMTSNQFPVSPMATSESFVFNIFVFHPCRPGLVRADNGRASVAKGHQESNSCNGKLCRT